MTKHRMISSRFGLPELLSYPATKKSVMQRCFRAVDTEYLDAVFEGKRKGLAQYEKTMRTKKND